MSGFGIASLGCAILSAHTTLAPLDGGWEEAIQLELAGGPACTHLRIGLPDGATLHRWRARMIRDDARNRRASPARLLPPEPTAEGHVRQLQLHDLSAGDRLRLHLVRHWPDPSPRYLSPTHFVVDGLPTSSATVPAQLELKGGVRILALDADHQPIEPGAPPPTLAWARVEHPWRSGELPVVPPVAQPLPLPEARRRLDALHLLPRAIDGLDPVVGDAALARGAVCDRGYARTLLALADDPALIVVHAVPEGPKDTDFLPAEAVHDPRTGAVYVHPNHHRATRFALPDGRLTQAEARGAPPSTEASVGVAVLTLALPEGDPTRALHPDAGASLHTALPLRAGAQAATITLPMPTRAHHTEVDLPPGGAGGAFGGAFRVYLPAHQRAVISWREPLVDAAGLLPAGATQATVRVRTPSGVQDAAVQTEADGWSLAALGDARLSDSAARAHEELNRRVREAAYPEPGVPIRLRGLSDGWERATALVDALLSRVHIAPLDTPPWWPRPLHRARGQGLLTELEAAAILTLYARQSRLEADLVLVREAGPAPRMPGQQDAVLVRWTHAGETRWTDLACTVCAPFEIRPPLAGSPALGADVERVPTDLAAGARRVEGEVVVLEGAEALRLRLALSVASPEETQAILDAAAGGRAKAAEGLATAGAPVRITRTSP